MASSSFIPRLKNAWNVFRNKDPSYEYRDYGLGYSSRPDRFIFTRGNESSLTNAIYNRIAVDAAAVDLFHVKLDENGRYSETLTDSPLNKCLTLSANMDQTGRALIQDAVMSMCDEGVVALVPVTTDVDPEKNTFDIYEIRTAEIIEWYPEHVRLRIYNSITGQKVEMTMSKESVCIVENPFYSVMNEPNSTMQRLIRKLNLLDFLDSQKGTNKLDLIIQLPYVIKNDLKRKEAETRRIELEKQLASSKFGIGYIDGTEHITQLNRPVENNLLSQIEYLTSMLYGQLGMTAEIMNGTADEQTMLNYQSRIIEPILNAFVEEMKRKWLSKTARAQGQSIMYFRDPFKLVPVNAIAEIADKMTRNEIMTSNEIRQSIGMKPSDDPTADELRNKNLNQKAEDAAQPDSNLNDLQSSEGDEEIQNEKNSAPKVTAEQMAELKKRRYNPNA